jgi:hypothetical protein
MGRVSSTLGQVAIHWLLADGDVACDRDDAQLLPEFILKRYCRVVLAHAHMAHIWGLQSFGHGQGIAEYDMPPRRRLPANAEIAVRAHMEPVLLKGGETVKSLSTAFLADLEEDWRNHGKEIFPILRAKYPQAYFQGIVSLARISSGGMSSLQVPLVERFHLRKLWTSWKSASARKVASCLSSASGR